MFAASSSRSIDFFPGDFPDTFLSSANPARGAVRHFHILIPGIATSCGPAAVVCFSERGRGQFPGLGVWCLPSRMVSESAMAASNWAREGVCR